LNHLSQNNILPVVPEVFVYLNENFLTLWAINFLTHISFLTFEKIENDIYTMFIQRGEVYNKNDFMIFILNISDAFLSKLLVLKIFPHTVKWFSVSLPPYSKTRIICKHCKCTVRKVWKNSNKWNCAASFPILHSCICERFIYSHDWFTNAIQQNRQTDRGNI